MSYVSRILNVFRRDRLDRDINEELESHIQEAIDSGRDPDEARRAFGSVLREREKSRDVRMARWLDSLRADVVFACRQLRKNKAASAAAVVSLALAMGACLSAFRLIDALLLRPLPVAHPERLFVVTYPYLDAAGNTQAGDSFDYPQFRALRNAVTHDAELFAITRPTRYGLAYGSDDQIERFWRQDVSGWMFSALGLKPALGRLLLPSDDVKPGANPVAVLSYDYWTRRFGRDPRVIGRKFRNGGTIYQIVGVAQEGFTGTEPGAVADIFQPTMMNAKAIENPNWSWFRIWVQLKPGRSPQRVQDELQAADQAYRRERVKAWKAKQPNGRYDAYLDAALSLHPASAGVSVLQADYRRALEVLAVVVALVLFIACANLANLMVAQAAGRAREMAVRVSLGAGRARLVQLVLVESALVALAASVLGLVFAWWSAPFVVSRINPPDNPARLILGADWRVLAFATGLLLGVTLLFGIIPALRASAVKPMTALRGGEDPYSRRRVMNVLIAAQVAFCFVVHFATGLFVTTFDRLAHQPTGFVGDGLLTIESATLYNKPSTHWQDVRRQLEAAPGVESAAISGWALLSGHGWSGQVSFNGVDQQGNDETYFLAVSPGWLRTMRIPIIGGRDFNSHDAYPGSAIVNEAFARRFLSGRNPVGGEFETMVNDKIERFRIVGYVGDARYLNMRESIRPTVYILFNDKPEGVDWATFVVRTRATNPLELAQTLRREITRAAPEIRVVNARTQTELVEQHTIRERLLAILSVFFAAVALVIAAVGIYGVLNYSVAQRRREIGIRMALGSTVAGIARGVISEVSTMMAMGAAAGLAAGMLSERYVESLLYAVKPTDPVIVAIPALTIFTAALLAAAPSVRNAVRTDPAVTLRVE